MKIPSKKILASILFVLISFVCVGQEDPPPPPGVPPGLPIDGGVFLGVLVGIVYGVKKILKRDN